VLEAGTVAHDRVVALGEDLRVLGDARRGVTVLQGSLYVGGRVEGSVTVLGGDAVLAKGSRVVGDVVVAGGRLRLEPGAQLEGRGIAYPSLPGAWLTLLEGPNLGLSALSPWVLGLKLGLAVAWLGWALLLCGGMPRTVQGLVGGVASRPWEGFLLGVAAVTSVVLLGLLLSSFVPEVLALPVLGLVVLLLVMAKLFGMVGVFVALGQALARLAERRPGLLDAATLGCLVLSAIKLIPFLGILVWSAVSVVGVGTVVRQLLFRSLPEGELGVAWARR
jgi:hypothetical protein